MTYAIDDADGNIITTGLTEHVVYAIAQRCADRLGASVYLYEVDSDAYTEITP